MMGCCGTSMRQKLLGCLCACSYASIKIGSELCLRIHLAGRRTRSVNETKKMLGRGVENNISRECGFERHEAFIDP